MTRKGKSHSKQTAVIILLSIVFVKMYTKLNSKYEIWEVSPTVSLVATKTLKLPYE